jgi:hypothetical protein
MPAWLEASSNRAQVRIWSAAGTPGRVSVAGSTKEVPLATLALTLKASEPRKSLSTAAAAALKVLCPEVYSGNAGVGT